MIKAVVLMYVIGVVIAAAQSEVTVALIGGGFTLINTALLAVLHRKATDIQADQKETRAALTAPRRIVYDQGGNPIGTVIDLHRGGGWDSWLSQHGRRAEDDEVPPV